MSLSKMCLDNILNVADVEGTSDTTNILTGNRVQEIAPMILQNIGKNTNAIAIAASGRFNALNNSVILATINVQNVFNAGETSDTRNNPNTAVVTKISSPSDGLAAVGINENLGPSPSPIIFAPQAPYPAPSYFHGSSASASRINSPIYYTAGSTSAEQKHYSEEEDHFMWFFSNDMGLSWSDVTAIFNKQFPERQRGTKRALRDRYCRVMKRAGLLGRGGLRTLEKGGMSTLRHNHKNVRYSWMSDARKVSWLITINGPKDD
ncbi:MAG: hypothetical protein M1829_006452 [Trizodia sp. TS-e1964]|nr:MAG: hypothetical protein M1829_006452 [Trizodia sp. TS-e1964]